MVTSSNAILVVDDDDDVRALVRSGLESENYEVFEAPDGETALRIFNKHELAGIILDLGIGKPDGLEVCRALRRQSDIPILMHTSHSGEIDEAMCMAAGADDYLTKPVSSRILGLHLDVLLRRRLASYSASSPQDLLMDDSFPDSPQLDFEEEFAPRRFNWFGLIGVALIPILLMGGWKYRSSHSIILSTPAYVSSGVQKMSTSDLKQSANSSGTIAYWLNVKPGDTYTKISNISGINVITYYPANSTVSNLNSVDVTVTTYLNSDIYNSQLHPLFGAYGRTQTLPNGSTLTYNLQSPDSALVTFSNRLEIVEINYPTTQSLLKLIGDAQQLTPIV